MTRPSEPPVLQTTGGDFPLAVCKLSVGGRELSVLHVAAILSRGDEDKYVTDTNNPLPYGAALWPSAIALAHEITTRADEFRGKQVLELGAGTGLPGIVAAALGARVVQTDRNDVALHLAKLNGERNAATGIQHYAGDWTEWTETRRFDFIIGADILYSDMMHVYLQRIFERNLAPGGKVLIADPFRKPSLVMLEGLVADGWRAIHSRWSIGDGDAARPVAVHELTAPR